jgi:hypothetical protein
MNTYHISRLPNGLIELRDYRCQWSILFNADGTYRHGGAGGSPAYTQAVREWLRSH